jgi:RNA polymerase sigma-70 factor (ECF subfamily)
MLDYSDVQLVSNYLKGDKESLGFLIKRYLKQIYNFVCHYVGNTADAEDITQEIFVRMWRNIKKFDRQKNFKTWIFSIAKNASIDFLRKKKNIPFSEFEDEEGGNAIIDTLVDPAPLPDEIIERADAAHLLNSALEKISPKYRVVLFLRYNDHFTFREIAESLGEPLETIKSRHGRALIALRKILAESF